MTVVTVYVDGRHTDYTNPSPRDAVRAALDAVHLLGVMPWEVERVTRGAEDVTAEFRQCLRDMAAREDEYRWNVLLPNLLKKKGVGV